MAAADSADEPPLDERAAVRAEFEELQRQYKHMEAMKKAYADESLGIIKKQKEMVEKIQAENGSLKAEVDLEMRFAAKKQAKDAALTTLHDQLDSYTTRVEIEKKNIATLTSNIEQTKAKIESLRAAVGGSRASQENFKVQQKQIKILENRLDKALVKFNEVLAENKTLRQEIDDLRQERVVFDGIYRRMERELEDKKLSMARIIEESNQAYEIRDAATVQLMDLQAAMAREREDFEREMADLEERIAAEDRAARHDREMEESHRGSLTITEEQELKERARRGERDLARDRSRMLEETERASSFEEAFSKIRAATGIDNVEDLVASFVKGEEANFSLFNYIAEQSAEVERLEDAIAEMRSEAEAASSASGARSDTNKHILRELETKLAATRAAVQAFEDRYTAAQASVDRLCDSIGRVFRHLDCHRRHMAELLSGGQVTESNAVQFLGVIEQRTNEILQAFAAAKAIDEGLAVAVPGQTAASATMAMGSPGPTRGSSGTFFATELPDTRPGTSGGPSLVVSEADRAQAARAIASVLGPGPASSHSPGKAQAIRVEAPRLRDMGSAADDDDDDEDDDAAARPMTMAELKASIRKSRR